MITDQAPRLTELLKHQFSNNARIKGQQYFTGRQVKRLEHAHHSVRARVSGTRDHEVGLDYNETINELECSCTSRG